MTDSNGGTETAGGSSLAPVWCSRCGRDCAGQYTITYRDGGQTVECPSCAAERLRKAGARPWADLRKWGLR